jgi:hypothetical protein
MVWQTCRVNMWRRRCKNLEYYKDNIGFIFFCIKKQKAAGKGHLKAMLDHFPAV